MNRLIQSALMCSACIIGAMGCNKERGGVEGGGGRAVQTQGQRISKWLRHSRSCRRWLENELFFGILHDGNPYFASTYFVRWPCVQTPATTPPPPDLADALNRKESTVGAAKQEMASHLQRAMEDPYKPNFQLPIQVASAAQEPKNKADAEGTGDEQPLEPPPVKALPGLAVIHQSVKPTARDTVESVVKVKYDTRIALAREANELGMKTAESNLRLASEGAEVRMGKPSIFVEDPNVATGIWVVRVTLTADVVRGTIKRMEARPLAMKKLTLADLIKSHKDNSGKTLTIEKLSLKGAEKSFVRDVYCLELESPDGTKVPASLNDADLPFICTADVAAKLRAALGRDESATVSITCVPREVPIPLDRRVAGRRWVAHVVSVTFLKPDGKPGRIVGQQ